jgi:hypothetical protein
MCWSCLSLWNAPASSAGISCNTSWSIWHLGNTRFFQIEGKINHSSKPKVYLRIQLL